MRPFALALSGMLLAGAAFAQQPAFQPQINAPQQPTAQPAPALNPQKDPLDWVLVNWEKSMSQVESLDAECRRIMVDKIFKKKTEFTGSAKFLKAQNTVMASLELTRVDRKDVFEKYIITGTFLYQFDPEKKVIIVHDLPKPPPGQAADNNLVSLIFGMKAAQAKQRYDLQYKGYDDHYLYVEIAPKQTQDKRDFARARLVLLRSNFMPRQLWFQEPNGNEITWDFPKLTTPAKLTVLQFQRPEVPPGWEMRRGTQQAQPRVMRNQE